MPTDLIQNIALAALQGFTEIFPVSSSGHLAVFGRIVGREMSFSKILFFHFGTFLAILLYYRRAVVRVATGKDGWKVPAFMLMSFAATASVGFVLEGTLAETLVQQPQYVALLWLINGAIVACVGLLTTPGSRKMSNLELREYLIIGIAQGIAALPGISRLGLTLGAGLAQKMSWSEALKLSFLLSLPTILAANLLKLLRFAATSAADPLSSPIAGPNLSLSHALLSYLFPVLVTLGCALLALHFLSRFFFLGRRLLLFFGLYCVVAGLFFSLYLNLL